MSQRFYVSLFFFFNDTATTEIYTLSLHDALPISRCGADGRRARCSRRTGSPPRASGRDRKSTRLNSSHSQISYAVFCLKKKKQKTGSPYGARDTVTESGVCIHATPRSFISAIYGE